MLYRVILYTPELYARGWEAVDCRVVGTQRAADLASETLLAPYERTESAYSAQVSRGAYARVETRAGTLVRYVEAPLQIVPSVGDLGWTP